MPDIQKIIGETSTFIIAIIVIVAFLVFFAHTLLYSDLATLEKVTALLTPFVAAVIGYFFGQRPAQASARQAEDANRLREEFRAGYERAREDVRIIDADERIARYVQELESLKRELGVE